jgi:hypothetical protein
VSTPIGQITKQSHSADFFAGYARPESLRSAALAVKAHELGVRLEEAPEVSGSYVPNAEKWPPGRCGWSGGCLIYTRGGKKFASAPLPRELKCFGLSAGDGHAASDV